MKADLSRSTFAQHKHYRDVRWQMGRVPVDADFNEHVDIVGHRVETETVDVIGRSGAPMHDAAFRIATSTAQLPPAQQAAAAALGPLAAGDFFLSAGRYYVDGVMCENDAPIKFSAQAAADLPDAAPLAGSGLYLVYLDVWARHVTFLDDPQIREVALGGPDTTTRRRNVWQVRAIRVGNAGAASNCDARFAAYDRATAASTGAMAAEVDPTPTSNRPCVLPPGGGYRRQENQLYRVEIHDGAPAGVGATFKWSRDNGAVVSGFERTGAADTIVLSHAPRDEVMGFAVGHWVEITDDRSELLGLPGFLASVSAVVGARLTLGAAIPAGFLRNPRVRRWDGASSTPVATGAWIPLEDGVRVRFTAGTFATGDYWMIPARTATGDVEWPRVGGGAAFVAPQGIAHHFSRIGFADFDGVTITPRDCRRLFLPLTEIGESVDLRRHNRHLHGRGVVCGLQVNCVGSDRASVRVRPGHAIDCAGTDILLEVPRRLNVVEQAKALGLLDAQGNADVQLTLAAQLDDEPLFGLRAADPEPDGAAAILNHIVEGTIWRDFYDDCLRPLSDYLRRELLEDEPDERSPVSRQKKQLLTVMNLLAHRAGTAAGRRLWLSEAQHAMLAKLYGDLVKLAGRSRTFCGIVDDMPEFPRYPFASESVRTAFVARKVSGVRLLPNTALAVAWSDDAPGLLHVFDLESGEMVRDLKLAASEGLAIEDAAVATLRGRTVLVVASADVNQTVLTLLDAEANKELDTFVLRGSSLGRLEAHTRRPEVLMAVERGRGVHFIDVARLASGPLAEPRWAFRAAGHLAVMNDRVCATEMPPRSADGSTYSALRFARLRPEGEDTFEDPVRLAELDESVQTGRDGIAMASTQAGLLLHVVVDPSGGRTAKGVLVIDAEKRRPLHRLDLPLADDGTETGPVAIASVQRPGRIVYALAKRNQLMWTPAEAPRLPVGLTLPAQAEPVALGNVALDGVPQLVVAVNRESMTLTLIPAKVLGEIAVTDPRSDEYRGALVGAFERLVRMLVQDLKDCLCEHLLVDCPQCAADEVLDLAKIEIRAGEVFHICNFDRQEVLTFPKVKYWLSAVPIIPLVGYLVEQFCCWVITPSPASAGGVRPSSLFTPAVALRGIGLFREGQAEAALVDQVARARTLSKHFTLDTVMRAPDPDPRKPDTGVRLSDVVDHDATTATTRLAERGVIVASVDDYDATVKRGGRELSAGKLPASLRAGEFVKLYTRGDRVVFYQVVSAGQPVPDPGSGTPGSDVRGDVDHLRAQLDKLRVAHDRELAERDRDLAELKLADAALDTELRRVAASAPAVGELRGTVETLRTELATVRDSHAKELAARDLQLAELRTSNERLSTELNVTTRKLQSDIERLGRTRPTG